MTTVDAPDGIARLLSSRDFVCLWWVGLTSFLIRWLEILVFGIVTYQLTNSAFLVAAMTMLRLLPMALFGAVFGTIAERIVRHHALLVVIAVSLLTATILTGVSIFGQLEVWHLGIASFINGTAWATDNSVRRTMIGDVVGNEWMSRAMSIEVGTSNASRLAGPSLGGLLLATAGIQGTLLLTLVLYVLAMIAALATSHRNEVPPTAGRSLLQTMSASWSVLRKDTRLTGAMCVTIVFNIFGWPVLSMVPVIGQDQLRLSPDSIGLLASADGLGALIGSLVIARLSRPGRFGRIYIVGVITFLGLLPAFALAGDPMLAGLALFLVGTGQAGFAIMQSTITFVTAPPGMRSQAMGMMTMCIGIGPIGFIVLGAMAETFGAPVTAVMMTLTGLIVLALSWRWWRDTWLT
ncbi:MAG: MFS transporter [Burkholderiaceae bacterium]